MIRNFASDNSLAKQGAPKAGEKGYLGQDISFENDTSRLSLRPRIVREKFVMICVTNVKKENNKTHLIGSSDPKLIPLSGV